MSLDELCSCFTRERGRFEREFIRAKNDGARIHLLIENASIDKVMDHEYRSKMAPKSLTSSIDAWSERYGIRAVSYTHLVLDQIRSSPMDEHYISLNDNYYTISDGYYAQDNTFVLEAGEVI